MQLGELSAGRQAPEGAELTPGSEETLHELRNPLKRPPHVHLLPPRVVRRDFSSWRRTNLPKFCGHLEEEQLQVRLGMTSEHLRPVHIFCSLWENIWHGGRFHLTLPARSVGIMRRIVARTIAQQISDVVERATAFYKHAMSTRAGTESSHALQALSELDPRATIVSTDGECVQPHLVESDDGGFDGVGAGSQILPFVRMFYGDHSTYLAQGTLLTRVVEGFWSAFGLSTGLRV